MPFVSPAIRLLVVSPLTATVDCELEPMKAEYHKLAGQIFLRAGERDKAANYFRQAIRWGGEDAEIRAALDTLEGKRKGGLLGGLFGRVE